MGRLTICALVFALIAAINAQIPDIHGTKNVSTTNNYPNDTLSLVILGTVNRKAYLFALQQASWFEANYFCNAHGMDMVSIETEHENDLVLEQISKLELTKTSFWTSGHKIGRSSWLWINGEMIIFSDWAIGEPSNYNTDHCIQIYDGNWGDWDCAYKYWSSRAGGFICEERQYVQVNEDMLNQSEPRSLYPAEFMNLVTLDPTTGKQYLFANVSTTWFGASYFCNAHGMDLVTIETQHENDLILAHIESLGMTKVMAYYTSAHKIGRSSWLWINGEFVIYSDWESGQPSDPTTDHCMFIFDGNWHDDDCEWRMSSNYDSAFICETRELPPENASELATRESYYPADMMNLVTLGPGSGKKYLVPDQLITWLEASYFCNAHGMDLVIIETQEENDAITNHLAFLGFNNSFIFTSGHKIGRATYLWINGEYMQYTDWAPGEPAEVDQNCLTLYIDNWYDLSCNAVALGFVCEERIPINT